MIWLSLKFRRGLMFFSFVMTLALLISTVPFAAWQDQCASTMAALGAAGWGLVVWLLVWWARHEEMFGLTLRSMEVQKECWRLRALKAEEKVKELLGDEENQGIEE